MISPELSRRVARVLDVLDLEPADRYRLVDAAVFYETWEALPEEHRETVSRGEELLSDRVR